MEWIDDCGEKESGKSLKSPALGDGHRSRVPSPCPPCTEGRWFCLEGLQVRACCEDRGCLYLGSPVTHSGYTWRHAGWGPCSHCPLHALCHPEKTCDTWLAHCHCEASTGRPCCALQGQDSLFACLLVTSGERCISNNVEQRRPRLEGCFCG